MVLAHHFGRRVEEPISGVEEPISGGGGEDSRAIGAARGGLFSGGSSGSVSSNTDAASSLPSGGPLLEEEHCEADPQITT